MLNALVFIDGVAFPVSDDFEGIEYLEPVSQTRHFLDHSQMHQPDADYPVGDLAKT